MGKAWYLARGREKHGPISGRELLLLAELGQLRGDDLLWRRGFRVWKAANSLPGILNPPPLPTELRAARRLGLIKFFHRLSASWRELPSLKDDWFKPVQLWGRDLCVRIKRVKFEQATFAVPQIVAGLLIAVVGWCVLDLARNSSFASSTQAAPQLPGLTSTVLNSTSGTVNPPSPTQSPEIIATAQTIQGNADSANLTDPLPSQKIVSVDEPAPESSAVLPIQIPLPTKKPPKLGDKRGFTSAPQPRPMRFGTIGFNYSGQ